MNASTTVAASILCVAAMAGCSRGGTLPDSVTGAWEQAFTRHDLAGCVALFTDDAEILPQHGPKVSGKKDIEAFLQDSMNQRVSYDTDTQMTIVRDDLAVEEVVTSSATCAVAWTSKRESTCTCGDAWATTGSSTA